MLKLSKFGVCISVSCVEMVVLDFLDWNNLNIGLNNENKFVGVVYFRELL